MRKLLAGTGLPGVLRFLCGLSLTVSAQSAADAQATISRAADAKTVEALTASGAGIAAAGAALSLNKREAITSVPSQHVQQLAYCSQ